MLRFSKQTEFVSISKFLIYIKHPLFSYHALTKYEEDMFASSATASPISHMHEACQTICKEWMIKVYSLRRSRCKLNAKKTIAHDDFTYRTATCKTLKNINSWAALIKLTLSNLMPLPWNLLINTIIYFYICSFLVTYLLKITVSTLWRSQYRNISCPSPMRLGEIHVKIYVFHRYAF